MNEGMILLNQKGEIIEYKPCGENCWTLAPDCIGSDMLSLCRNLELQEILTKALHGERGENIIRLYGESYQIDADPITSENIVKGAALFFSM